jgi:hypothetical protein
MEMETLKEEIKSAETANAIGAAATVAAAQNGSGLDPLSSSVNTSSAPPSAPSTIRSVRVPQLWSHKYTITFDTVQNTKTAYAVLSSMKLSPNLPSPHIITGTFLGLPFNAPHEKKQAHFQQEAWYEGGAPSFMYTPIEQTDTVVHGFTSTQFRDECYFSCLSTHWNHVQSMPSFNGRPFTFQRYTRSKVKVCYHCQQVGHKMIACASKHISNAAGQRDACIMCGSFDHVNASCPARNDPAATCMLCKKGKHTSRACPLYRGTYTHVPTRQNTQTKHIQKAWGTGKTVEIVAGQQQPQRHQQQHTQAYGQQRPGWKPKQPQERQRDTHETSAHVQMYITQIAQQGKVIDALQKTMEGMAKTMEGMSKQIEAMNTLLSASMSQSHTHTNTQIQDMTSVDIVNTTPLTSTTAHTGKTTDAGTEKPHVTGKKAKTTHAVNNNDITKGTPRIGGYFAPLIATTTTTTTTSNTSRDEARETDASMDPASAFNALTSSNATGLGKRHRKESEVGDTTISNTLTTTRQTSHPQQKGNK